MNRWGLFLLWLAGVNLRITVLAVPPVIPYIHDDLHLSEKAIGALGGVPTLIYGAGALFGALLLARIGVIRALVAGLALAALGGAFRGLGPDAAILFSMTGLMALGIAIMQPAMPTLVAHWFRTNPGFATAVYINGLLVGEIIGAASTGMIARMTGSWGVALGGWSVLLLANIVLLIWALKRGAVDRPGLRGSALQTGWWPDWRNRRMLLAGGILGCASSLYFTSNTFIPDFLHATGRGGATEAALTALNGCQIPASLLLLLLARRAVGARWPLMAVGALASLAVAALAVGKTPLTAIAAAGVIGFCAASTLILVMALPPLLAQDKDVHRFSAGMLAIGYPLSFLTSVVSGMVWDASHVPASAFIPILTACLGLIGLSTLLHIRAENR